MSIWGKTDEQTTFLRLGSETFFAEFNSTGRKISHYPIHEAVFSLLGALLKIENLGKFSLRPQTVASGKF